MDEHDLRRIVREELERQQEQQYRVHHPLVE